MPCRRTKAVPFHEVVTAARTCALERPRSYLTPNWFLAVFTLSGVALILARLWVEIAMMNLRLHRDGTQTLTAEQLQDLKAQISAGRAFSTALLVVFIAVGSAARSGRAASGCTYRHPGREVCRFRARRIVIGSTRSRCWCAGRMACSAPMTRCSWRSPVARCP